MKSGTGSGGVLSGETEVVVTRVEVGPEGETSPLSDPREGEIVGT